MDGFPNALPTTPPPSVLLTNSYIAQLPIRKMSKVSPLSNGSTRTFMSPVGRRPVHSGVQSRRRCLSWRGDIHGENRQFRPVTGARQERSTWQTDVWNRRSTGPDANIDKPFTSLNGAACSFIILSKLTTTKPNPAVRVGPNLSFPRVINFKFLLRPHQKYCITQCEKLGFSWLTHMKDSYTTKILTSSLIRFSSKGWENVCFELGNERVVGKVNCRRICTV